MYGGREKDFLRFGTLLIYDYFSPTLGPNSWPKSHEFYSIGRGRHGHHYNAFSFFPHMCESRGEDFWEFGFFIYSASSLAPGGGEAMNLTILIPYGRKPNCNRSPECLDLKWRGIKRYATEKGRINAYATETGVIHQHQSTNISTHWRSRPKMAWILLKYTDRYVQPYLKSWKSCVTKLRILREFSLSSMDTYLFLNLVVNLT